LEVRFIADSRSGPAEGVKGVVQDVKGKAKEAAGTVAGNDSLQREGRAQDKAESQREAARKEAAAEKARAEAGANEARQRAEQ
jgi:uncharacterized protein YjbJ (UPF0337 family)